MRWALLFLVGCGGQVLDAPKCADPNWECCLFITPVDGGVTYSCRCVEPDYVCKAEI